MSTAVSASVDPSYPFHRSDSNRSLELEANSSDEMNETMFPPPSRRTEMMTEQHMDVSKVRKTEQENDTTPPAPSSSPSGGFVIDEIVEEEEEERIEVHHDDIQKRKQENDTTSPMPCESNPNNDSSVIHKIVKEKQKREMQDTKEKNDTIPSNNPYNDIIHKIVEKKQKSKMREECKTSVETQQQKTDTTTPGYPVPVPSSASNSTIIHKIVPNSSEQKSGGTSMHTHHETAPQDSVIGHSNGFDDESQQATHQHRAAYACDEEEEYESDYDHMERDDDRRFETFVLENRESRVVEQVSTVMVPKKQRKQQLKLLGKIMSREHTRPVVEQRTNGDKEEPTHLGGQESYNEEEGFGESPSRPLQQFAGNAEDTYKEEISLAAETSFSSGSTRHTRSYQNHGDDDTNTHPSQNGGNHGQFWNPSAHVVGSTRLHTEEEEDCDVEEEDFLPRKQQQHIPPIEAATDGANTDAQKMTNEEEKQKEKKKVESDPELTETPEITESPPLEQARENGGDNYNNGNITQMEYGNYQYAPRYEQSQQHMPHDGSPNGMGKNTVMHGKLTRNYSDASQTMKHHLHICLKFVGLMYQHYEERIKVGTIKDCDKDERYLQVVMLNSSLLKALHVCESFQAHCVREFPEISFDFDDPLTSFDGTLTTIYEGEDMSSVTDRIPVPVEQPVPAEVHRSLQTECVCLRDSKNAIEAQGHELEEKVLELEKIIEEGLVREKKNKRAVGRA